MTRKERRWPRRLAYIAVGVLVTVAAVYGWARLSVDRSTIARALVWGDADVGDQFRFPSRPIPAGEDASPLSAGVEIDPRLPPAVPGGGAAFDDFLRANATRAFLVVHEDPVVYERYFGGSDRHTLHTSFSVAKSVKPHPTLSSRAETRVPDKGVGDLDRSRLFSCLPREEPT